MIIDTHIHLYDTEREQGVPWPKPESGSIYQPSMPDRYRALAEPAGVTGVIVVEASGWLEDNQWILDIAEDEPLVKGFVGNLDPADENFEANLDRFAANSLFRGIRARAGGPTPYGSEALDTCAKMLAERNLSMDLMVRPEELTKLADFAGSHSTLRVVVNHTASVAVDGMSPDPVWTAGIRALKDCSNVYCKLSGMVEHAVEQPAPADIDYYRPTVDVLVDALGIDRLFYSSNWTPCELSGEYALTLNILREYFSDVGGDVLEKILWRNSKEAYRWQTRNLSG